MAQILVVEAAEPRTTRLEDAPLRARQSRSQQSEHNRLQMAERCQQETAYQPYNRLAFRYNPAEDYSLTRHVLVRTMMVVCPYCKALKFSGETKEMYCAAEKIKLPELREPPELLKTWLAGYTTETKHFLCNIRIYNYYFPMTRFGEEIIKTHFLGELSK
ncbi:uncharacterized protein TNCV_3743331 [Trichonephila clavipes]|nr:uncharacterized protein TNCV_3743331 [Trichonephila clavipes]